MTQAIVIRTLRDFIRLHGTAQCTTRANTVFRKLFRMNVTSYFRVVGDRTTLEEDLRKATVGLTPSEIEKLADIFQREAEL